MSSPFKTPMGNKKPFRPTGLHKFYREESDTWAPVTDLLPGEHIRGRFGNLTVLAVRCVPGIHRVYNLTVEGEHVYSVTALGVLSHNNGIGGGGCGATPPQGGTYVLKDGNEVMRSGRTNDLLRRQGEHGRDPVLKKFDFKIDRRTDNYAQQRGREQILHDKYKPPLNKINPISPKNPNRQKYLDCAKELK